MVELLRWCDEMITLLKGEGIKFCNGMPVLPSEAIYNGVPMMIENFSHRNDIPPELKSCSLISHFSYDDNLTNRLFNIKEEIQVIKEYGGMCGFDYSPCITMLRPRQQLSLLISALYNCYAAINGVKILINCRVGDLDTMPLANIIPVHSNIITGELGCHNNGFRTYGVCQLKFICKCVKPDILFVCGALSKKDLQYIFGNSIQLIIMYPGRRHRMRDDKKPVAVTYNGGKCNRQLLYEYMESEGLRYGC